MIKLKQMRTLLCGKPVKQTKQKKKHRTVKAVLLSTVIGLLLDVQEGRWRNDLWKPKG